MNLSALQSRNFRTYLFGNIFALNALWMQRVTIGWIAWDLTGAAGFVGLVAFAGFAPTLFLGPLFGVLADRTDVKSAALATQSTLMLVSLGLTLSAFAGLLSPAILLLLTSLHGVVAALYSPIRLSLSPRLVPRKDVASVVNIVGINFNLARLIGPALGGVLLSQIGVAPSLAIQTACYLPFLLALSRIEVRPRKDAPGKAAQGFGAAFGEGFHFARQNRLVLQAFLLSGTISIAVRGALEVLPVLADGVFDEGAAGLGLLTSAAGLGALVAGLAKALAPPQRAGHLPLTGQVAALGGALLLLPLALTANWPLALMLVALLGFATTLFGISMQTSVQQELEDDIRGRVMSFWVVIAIGGTAIGAGLFGLAIDLFGHRASFLTFGLLAFGTCLALMIRRR